MARGMGGQRRASFHPWRHSRGVDRSRRRLGAGPADRPRRADHRHARRLPKGAAPGDLPIEFPKKSAPHRLDPFGRSFIERESPRKDGRVMGAITPAAAIKIVKREGTAVFTGVPP